MQSSLATQMVTGKTDDSSLHLKLSNLLLGLIIFFSASQLGLHFWPLSTLVYGIRVDYLAPTVYLFDLLLLGYLVARRSDLIVTLIPILLVNLLYSQNPFATLSWSLHFLLYFVFLRSILSPGSDLLRRSWPTAKMFSRTSKTSSETRSDPQGKFENLRIFDLRLILFLALLFQLALAGIQVYLGHSIGGLMYYLGERSVAVGQPAVALGTFMDSVVLRAYGTFGHPNVLAGWSVIVLLILLRFKPATKYQILYTAIAACGVALTQSRSAALALFGLIIPFYLIKNRKLRLLYCLTGLLIYWFTPFFSPPRSDLSLSQRLDLQGQSLKVISQYPVFGAGANASISTYSAIAPNFRLLQPDHNSFTLFLSWFGLFGVLAILHSLRSPIIHYSLFIIPLVPLLALDHYFLTSPQGLFILILYIQVALNYSHAQKNLQ